MRYVLSPFVRYQVLYYTLLYDRLAEVDAQRCAMEAFSPRYDGVILDERMI